MASLTFIAVALLLLLVLYRYILFPLFFSPLSKIPNAHFSAPILPLWIRAQRKTGTAVITLLALHEKHGSVVRLAPNEISINSADALRTVYVGGFNKHRFYMDAFVNYGSPNMVSMLESKPHSVQKRMVSNLYSKSYLQSSTDLRKISDRLIFDRFLPLMQQFEERGGEVDVLDFMQAVGMDLTSAYLFGSSNGSDFMHDVQFRHRWLEEYKTFKFQLPHDRADGLIERWCFSMCEAAERSIRSEKVKDDLSETQPVVYGRLAKSLQESALTDDPSLKPTMRTTASEMLDHLIAGHETSGITLSYLMYELSLHPELQDRLRAELLTLTPPIVYPAGGSNGADGNSDGSLPSPRSIDALPLLNNILQETLRLYAAAPAQQPRITPFSSSGTTIDGYSNIPGGVMVSANAHSLHRNAVVFPEPLVWRPERWDGSAEEKEEMRRWFWAFGSGGRMCLGSNFALQGMKLIIATVYSNFRTEVTHHEGMQQTDTYIAVPAGGKCVLRFQRV